MRRLMWTLLLTTTLLVQAQDPFALLDPEEPVTEQMLDFSMIVNSRAYRFDTILEEDVPYFSMQSVFRALGPTGLTITGQTAKQASIQLSEEEQFTLDFASGVLKQTEGDRVFSTGVILVEKRPYLRFDFMTKVLPDLLGKEVSFDGGTNTFFLGQRESVRLGYDIKVAEEYAVLSLLFPARVRYRIEQIDTELTLTINSQFQQPMEDFLLEENPFFTITGYRMEPSRTVITLTVTDRVNALNDSFDKNFNRLRLYFYSPEYHNPGAEAVNQALPMYRPDVTTVKKIIIDPGHGGEDEGAIGSKGIMEKDITLTISYKLAAELKRRGYEVVLTRYTDVHVPLVDRTGIANTNQGDIFVSIHVNASVRRASGAETYYLSLKGAETVSDTIAFENREISQSGASATDTGNKQEGNDLLFILWDMAQAEYLKDSALLAEEIQKSMNLMTGIRDRGVKQANLVVLRGLNMPGVLVEVAFISNPSEEARLTQDSFQDRTTQALADSIDSYKAGLERRMAPVSREREEGRLP